MTITEYEKLEITFHKFIKLERIDDIEIRLKESYEIEAWWCYTCNTVGTFRCTPVIFKSTHYLHGFENYKKLCPACTKDAIKWKKINNKKGLIRK